MNNSKPPAEKRSWTLLSAYVVLAPLLFGALLVLFSQSPFFQQLEFLSMDYRFRARAELGFDPPASHEIIRVGVDEESLAKLGRWPWDRTIHADLCQLLAAADVAVGAFDFLFTEPSAEGEADSVLAQTGGGMRAFVSGAAAEYNAEAPRGLSNPPGRTRPLSRIEGDVGRVPVARGALTPIPELAKTTWFGFVNADPTSADGIRRKLPLIFKVDGDFYAGFALKILMARWSVKEDDVVVRLGKFISLPRPEGELRIPINQAGELWINYRDEETFRRVGYDELLIELAGHFMENKPLAPELADLQDKIIVVGQVAVGMTDLGPNPLANIAPLVQVHINVLNSILTGDHLNVVPIWPWPALGWIVVAGAFLFLLRGQTTVRSIIWPTFTVAAYTAVAFVLFAAHSISLPLVLPVLGFLMIGTGAITVRWVAEQDDRRRVSARLEQEKAARELLEKELQIAHDIQVSMLPKEFFSERTQFDIYAKMKPAKSVGGDLYDFFFIDDKHLFFVIGDVAGKGVPAALFMTMALSIFRVSAVTGIPPGEILARSNNTLAMQNSSCTFVTTFCGMLNTETGHVAYANGGHNPPIVFDGKGNVRFLEQEGVALGALEDMPYTSRELTLAAGEGLLLYTDGVTEAFNPALEMFDEVRLEESVKAGSANAPCKIIATKLWNDLDAFVNGAPQADDITLLTLKYHGN